MAMQINKIQKESETKELRFTKRISELERQSSSLRKNIEKDCTCFTETNDNDELPVYYNTSKPHKKDGMLETEIDKKNMNDQWV